MEQAPVNLCLKEVCPATSNKQNPAFVYANTCSFDITLTLHVIIPNGVMTKKIFRN